MTTTEQANLELALDYMASLENGATPQEEFPNRLMPNGARGGGAR